MAAVIRPQYTGWAKSRVTVIVCHCPQFSVTANKKKRIFQLYNVFKTRVSSIEQGFSNMFYNSYLKPDCQGETDNEVTVTILLAHPVFSPLKGFSFHCNWQVCCHLILIHIFAYIPSEIVVKSHF